MKHGLLPSVIERETGQRTAVNLSAARRPLSYLLLRRALGAGARPRAIIINAKPAILMADLQFNARYFREIVTARECLEISGLTRNRPFLLSMIVGRLLPSLRSRLEIQTNVLAAVRGETDRIGAINRVLLPELDGQPRGQRCSDGFSQPRDGQSRRRSSGCTRACFTWIGPTPRESVRLMRLAENRSIPVFCGSCPRCRRASPILARPRADPRPRYRTIHPICHGALSATIDRARRPPRRFSFDLFHR